MSTYTETVRKFPLLYRAIVESLKYSDPERVVFVEAFTRADARQKIRSAIAAIDGCDSEQVEYYNLDDIRELLDGHFSEDCEMRIFETGGGLRDDGPYENYCEHPLFLTKDPRKLIDVWMKCHRVNERTTTSVAPGERDGLHG